MTYGYVSVKSHPRESRIARVRVNGEDVTLRCFAANDVQGFADCYRVNAQGRKFVTARGEMACERLTGTVIIDFPRGLE